MERKLLGRVLEAIGGEDCWEWHGTRDAAGYGVIRVGDRILRAHRVVYEAAVAQIPDLLVLDHLCENKGCVNPDHLEPVTHGENTRRAAAKRDHCVHGHTYTDENTGHKPDGSRRCRACGRAAAKRYRERLAA